MGYTVPATAYLDDPGGLSEYRANVEMVQADIERAKLGETITREYRIINQKDNQLRWIRVTRQPIWNKEHNRVVRYLGAVKDVTLEKEAERVSREAMSFVRLSNVKKGYMPYARGLFRWSHTSSVIHWRLFSVLHRS
jgi:hypothetical protein